MTTACLPIARCAEIAGLQPTELVVGVTPTPIHERILDRYLSRAKGYVAARAQIVADMRDALAIGAQARAADLLLVLRLLLSLETSARGGRGVRRQSKSGQRSARSVADGALRAQAAGRAGEGCQIIFLDDYRRPFALRGKLRKGVA